MKNPSYSNLGMPSRYVRNRSQSGYNTRSSSVESRSSGKNSIAASTRSRSPVSPNRRAQAYKPSSAVTSSLRSNTPDAQPPVVNDRAQAYKPSSAVTSPSRSNTPVVQRSISPIDKEPPKKAVTIREWIAANSSRWAEISARVDAYVTSKKALLKYELDKQNQKHPLLYSYTNARLSLATERSTKHQSYARLAALEAGLIKEADPLVDTIMCGVSRLSHFETKRLCDSMMSMMITERLTTFIEVHKNVMVSNFRYRNDGDHVFTFDYTGKEFISFKISINDKSTVFGAYTEISTQGGIIYLENGPDVDLPDSCPIKKTVVEALQFFWEHKEEIFKAAMI